MSSIQIPSPLRIYTDGEKHIEVEGRTIQDAIKNLVTLYPRLEEHIYNHQGEIRPYVNIYLNGDDVRGLNGGTTRLIEGDRLMIVPRSPAEKFAFFRSIC